MTLPRLYGFLESWEEAPPVSMSVANFLYGGKKSSDVSEENPGDAEELISTLSQSTGFSVRKEIG